MAAITSVISTHFQPGKLKLIQFLHARKPSMDCIVQYTHSLDHNFIIVHILCGKNDAWWSDSKYQHGRRRVHTVYAVGAPAQRVTVVVV